MTTRESVLVLVNLILAHGASGFFGAVGICPPLNASLASPFGRGGGEADGEGESVTRPSQSPAVTALPEGEPRLQLFYGHPRDPRGNGGRQPPKTPAPQRRGNSVIEIERLLGLAGIIQKGGRRPLLVVSRG